MVDPLKTEPPSPMYQCECGQSIYKQNDDTILRCYDCGREYDDANNLEVVHALCPRCSTKITNVGRHYMSHSPKKWVVDYVDCPRCNYTYEASMW